MYVYLECTGKTASVCFSARKRGRPRKSERKNPKSSATISETMSFPEQSKMDADVFELCVCEIHWHLFFDAENCIMSAALTRYTLCTKFLNITLLGTRRK